jgi:hypothetical protein
MRGRRQSVTAIVIVKALFISPGHAVFWIEYASALRDEKAGALCSGLWFVNDYRHQNS